MLRACVCGIALGVAAMLASGVTAGVVKPMTVQQQAREADRIFIGDVVSVDSYWNEDQTQIRTRIEIVPTDYIKGEPRKREVLDYVGGKVDDMTLIRTDTPFFEKGMHVLLFLDAEDFMVGAFQGGYLTDGESAMRMVMPLDRFDPATQQPLGLVLAHVARALGMTQLPPISSYDGPYELPSAGERFVAFGPSWSGVCEPIANDYFINGNCADASAGSAANQRAAIQAGADVWSMQDLGFAFSYGGPTTSTSDANDGVFNVFFCPSGNCGLNSSTIAATGILINTCGNIVEFDMIFNDAQFTFWDGQTGSCSGMQDIQAVAAHEFGHALGLDHSGVSAATMWATVSTCSTAARSLHPDDVAGLDALYDEQVVVNDVCADAIDIAEGDTPINTACATTDGPTHVGCNLFGFSGVDFDIWYRYQATCTGTLTVSTCMTQTPSGNVPPSYDSKIAVYNGTNCGALNANLIGCNDDSPGCNCNTSRVVVPVVGGEWYLIRVGGWQNSFGADVLNISCEGEPWVPCEGDVNGDNIVDLTDLLAVISGWGDQYDLSDLLLVISNWSNNC